MLSPVAKGLTVHCIFATWYQGFRGWFKTNFWACDRCVSYINYFYYSTCMQVCRPIIDVLQYQDDQRQSRGKPQRLSPLQKANNAHSNYSFQVLIYKEQTLHARQFSQALLSNDNPNPNPIPFVCPPERYAILNSWYNLVLKKLVFTIANSLFIHLKTIHRYTFIIKTLILLAGMESNLL